MLTSNSKRQRATTFWFIIYGPNMTKFKGIKPDKKRKIKEDKMTHIDDKFKNQEEK